MSREIFIRLADQGFAFVYSIRRGADVIEFSVVDADDAAVREEPSDGYFGGSAAVD